MSRCLFSLAYSTPLLIRLRTHFLNGDAVNSAVTYILSKNRDMLQIQVPTISRSRCFRLFKYDQFVAQSSTINSLFTADNIAAIDHFSDGPGMFGLGFGSAYPPTTVSGQSYLIFPALCLVSNIGSQFIMTKVNSSAMGQQQGCMKVAMYLLPLFSAYITYSVPSALGFYWFISRDHQSYTVYRAREGIKKSREAHRKQRGKTRRSLLFANEAKVPYVYAPSESASAGNVKRLKRKRRSKVLEFFRGRKYD